MEEVTAEGCTVTGRPSPRETTADSRRFFAFFFFFSEKIKPKTSIVNIVPVQKHRLQDVVGTRRQRRASLLLHRLLDLFQPADELLGLAVAQAGVQHPHDGLLWKTRAEDTLDAGARQAKAGPGLGGGGRSYAPLGLLRDRCRMTGCTLFPAGEALGLPGQQKSLRGATASPAKSLVESQS